jgi:hypothetical protein
MFRIGGSPGRNAKWNIGQKAGQVHPPEVPRYHNLFAPHRRGPGGFGLACVLEEQVPPRIAEGRLVRVPED